jgi:hypothetical protein
MPQDLNKIMDGIQKDSKELESKMEELMVRYDELYREGNRQYLQERAASAVMDGLENFYILVQTIRRNRDVIGSLLRGIKNLRNLSKYKFVEETVPEPKLKKKKESKTSRPVPEPVLPPEITEPQKQEEVIDA